MRQAAERLRATDPQRLLLWMPMISSVVGLLLLEAFGLSGPLYVGILLLLLGFGLLALFGPRGLRGTLLVVAPQVYSLLLLLAWGAALYLLPGHPASGMVLLAAGLHLPTIYVFVFLQWPPRLAFRLSVLTLLLFLALTVPHTWVTRAQFGPYQGPGLPLTLLFAHGTLLLVLQSFSQARDQLAHEQERARLMHELAHRDPLTGLLNRRALETDLRGAAPGGLLAVIDVDGLKQVNDTLGHAAGDRLLTLFAEGFGRQAAAGGGQAYRISGDEFALLMPDREAEEVEALLAEVVAQVRGTYPFAAASMGLARRRHAESSEGWLSRADGAMYAQKRLSRLGGRGAQTETLPDTH